MKICIFGAGAIGGVAGGLLSAAGYEVSMIARGAHLDAMKQRGCIVESGGRRIETAPVCSDDPADLGTQDYVILSVKAPALPEVARGIGPLLGPGTVVVTAMNGVPWWFFDGFPAGGDKISLGGLDPDRALAGAIKSERLIGCVIHMGATVVEPGVVRHVADNRFILGEPGGQPSSRVRALAEALNRTPLDATVSDDIRHEIWLKLLGNFNFNPIAALTGATNGDIGADPQIRALCAATYDEAVRVGARLGLQPGMTADERIDIGASLGDFKASMLQDFEKGRPPEIDAIVGVVVEIGNALGEPMPLTRAVLALVAQKARGLGIYSG